MKTIPLRRRLLLVVAAAVVPLAIVAAFALSTIYQQQREQAARAGLEISRALSTAVDAELRRTISVLEVLASSVALDDDDQARFQERARRTLALQPFWRAIVLNDAQGRSILHTGYPVGAEMPSLTERESFDKVMATHAPAVGFLARAPNGEYWVPVRVPVTRRGVLRYVLSAQLDPAAILDLLNRERVPGDWVVAVSDAKGMRVARTRSTQQSLGTPFSPTLVEMMARGGSEGSGITYSSEGDSVFTAYSRAPGTGWITAVGLPTRLVEVGAHDSFVVFGGGILLSILLGIGAAWLFARSVNRPMAQLREGAVSMGRGGTFVPPVSDIREIDDVANALAAAQRERSEAEVERERLLRREQAARAAAEAANRAKDEFLAMLGHELRNPLGAISNAASLMDNPAADATTTGRARSIIVRQVRHLTRLTDDLLDAGRALTGKIVLRPQPLDLAAVAAQSLATIKASGRAHKHDLVEDLESVWVEADSIRLDQVIGNLVVNAVKYTPAGGTIRVSVRREGGDAALRVADNGIGLSPELAGRVFELFVQGDRDLDRSQGGLGIGLTLVRRLAEMHGGSAEVASEGEGKGSEFTVRFPAIEPHAAPAPVPEPGPARTAPAASRHVLVVEDNEDARETLRIVLEMAGHRVETAADGQDGLEKALATQPEIALLDVGLPKLDGYELARRIRASRGIRRPFLVALTGYGLPEDRERAFEAGFDAHLVKPVDADTLAELMATWTSVPSESARR